MEIMLDLPPLKERISIAPVLLLVAAGHAIMTSSPATLLKCDEIQPFSRPVPHDAGRKNKKKCKLYPPISVPHIRIADTDVHTTAKTRLASGEGRSFH